MSRHNNILLIGWYFYPKTGGVESLMLAQAIQLVKKGYRVTVLTSPINGEESNEDHAGIKIIRRSSLVVDRPMKNTQIEQEINQVLDEIKPQVVHFHNGSNSSGAKDRSIGVKKILSIFEVIKNRQIPIIEHAHNAQLNDPKTTKPLRDLPWDELICVSQFVKDSWLKLGTRAKKIAVVPNGINFEKFEAANPSPEILGIKKPNEKIIFFPARIVRISTGEISAQKNFRAVIETVKILHEKGVNNFRIVGLLNESTAESAAGKTIKVLKDELIEAGISDCFSFLPAIEPEKMPSYYAASDVVCVPSVNETFGLVYVEAMAAGKIAIASNTGAPQEYIKDGINGFLVNPENPKELAEKLSLILSNDKTAQNIGQAAKITAQNFSIDKMVAKIIAVYQTLTSRNDR